MSENKKTPQEQSREELYLREILEQTVKTNRHFLVLYILVGIVFVCGVTLPLLFPR